MDGKRYPLELLSPARDLECGIAAVDHGADAVYIGPPRFGARAAAGNSLEDIEQLVRYAHVFRVRIYVTLNTLFDDRELEDAAVLAGQLHDIGVDALIIQDMGLLECSLPPIPLHASTQADNRTPEKVLFLEKAGFRQVVLARELSLDQIRAIRKNTHVPLEVFVHGSLCVSYSGRCYISERMAGRSANRGECAQFCRHAYNLTDSSGRVIDTGRHFLSMKDLDLSDRIGDLIDAGVSSFKIEGRLKDASYVKNITAFYRRILDRHMGSGDGRVRSSSGICRFDFVPDPQKTFNRGRTEYFLTGGKARPAALDTPKFVGERIGVSGYPGRGMFSLKHIDDGVVLHNGDGLAYFGDDGVLDGLKVNRIDGKTVYFHDGLPPPEGAGIYRNHDVVFTRMLEASRDCRFIELDVLVTRTPEGLACGIRDDDGVCSVTESVIGPEISREPGTARRTIERQFLKTGGTRFRIRALDVRIDDDLYVRVSDVNALRRRALEGHLEQRRREYSPQRVNLVPNDFPWPSERVTAEDNITNEKARAFYRRHGVQSFDLPASGGGDSASAALMTCRYCIREQLGICLRTDAGRTGPKGPLSLIDHTGSYELDFDCDRCEMTVHLTTADVTRGRR